MSSYLGRPNPQLAHNPTPSSRGTPSSETKSRTRFLASASPPRGRTRTPGHESLPSRPSETPQSRESPRPVATAPRTASLLLNFSFSF
ncbi:hypothetical protein CRG98_013065 [Punica granatum]|uniref:Uncharacterized protein n=1 Tax=Punica granatum TaxID=22663 RepID=A0A2I0KDE7_PUNGR|nr:hypothetical protein CRG98_013065 [Punica granatum]